MDRSPSELFGTGAALAGFALTALALVVLFLA